MNSRPLLRDQNLIYFDIGLTALSVIGSFVLRLELLQFFLDYIPAAALFLGAALLVKPLVYRRFGLYRRLWAYASTPELRLIVLAVSVASAIVTLIVVLVQPFVLTIYAPRTIFIIDWLLSVLLIGAVRFGLRIFSEGRSSPGTVPGGVKRALIIGAGSAGALVVRELEKNPQMKLEPLAFLDDDPEKQDLQIHGVPVVGSLHELPRELDTKPIDEVIIAIPSAPGSVLRQVSDVCRKRGVPFRTMPGIYELIGGVVSVSRLREVDITDLLRREPTPIDNTRVGESLEGKRVLVTGAGGSIASELCRQIARWGPAEVTLLGHGENSIFEILLELEETYPGISFHPVIADIRNPKRLKQVFGEHAPQVVFHAAAHKHVHLMEMNVEEAVTNNILGTRNVVSATLDAEVNRLVMISTDKAVRPTSVMGATKRMAEMIVLDAAQRSRCAFSVVRFGNVLESRGSVVPLFKRQIARGGPVTVTHPKMERFFMTIPEAVHLVLQASSLGENGEMFVLDMGEPVKILDLAEDMIRLSGLEPGVDVEIVFTGRKTGEKLSEQLWEAGADYQPTAHPDIRRLVEEPAISGASLEETVDRMISLANQGEAEALVQMLDELIPGADIRGTPPPELTALP